MKILVLITAFADRLDPLQQFAAALACIALCVMLHYLPYALKETDLWRVYIKINKLFYRKIK